MKTHTVNTDSKKKNTLDLSLLDVDSRQALLSLYKFLKEKESKATKDKQKEN